jgi:broad specificity phosphatase PhoE
MLRVFVVALALALGACRPATEAPAARPSPPEPAAAEPSASTDALQVYLVRHGQAFSNLDPAPKMSEAELDRLTPLGHEQAAETGRALASREPALILTSPAGRARETADEVGQAVGEVAVRSEPRLRPLQLGRSASGAAGTWDERIAEWKAGRDPVPPEGESLAQLGLRVLAALRDEQKRRSGRAVVVVAHSDVIGALLALARGDAPAKAYPFTVRNGSVSLVEVDAAGKPALVFANLLPDELPSP